MPMLRRDIFQRMQKYPGRMAMVRRALRQRLLESQRKDYVPTGRHKRFSPRDSSDGVGLRGGGDMGRIRNL